MRNKIDIPLVYGYSKTFNKYSQRLIGDRWSKKQFVLDRVSEDGCDLDWAHKSLQDDKEVVLTAVRQNGYALRWASDRLRNDKEVVMAALNEWLGALSFAGNELKNDPEFTNLVKLLGS